MLYMNYLCNNIVLVAQYFLIQADAQSIFLFL